ncbi:MAG: Lipopolysaccharide assembly protein B [Planctomycetes bacterium]|nr:Lipopolysaccharide assembly protein B [Planctomycetota bacterium]
MSSIAVIPFSTRISDELAGHVARGLSLELSDWLTDQGGECLVLTSAQTEEDGAWRKLVSFNEELSSEAVNELIHGIPDENGHEPEFKLVVSGIIEQIADTQYQDGLHIAISVTDLSGGFSRGRFTADLMPASFGDSIAGLFRQVAEALGLAAKSPYATITRNFQAWLNLLITRALILAAEVGAVARDAKGVYNPALEALRLDPAFTVARDKLGDLAQALVLERGFEAGEAVKALDQAVARSGADWRTLRARGHLMLAANEPSNAAKAFCQVLSGKFEAPDKSERMRAALLAGKAFNLAERHVEAQRVLSVAMQAENLRVEAIVESATSSAALGENAVAERLWRRALELEPQSIAARLYLARLYRSRGEADKAAEQYEELIKAPGLPREVFADAAEFFVVNGRHEQALGAAERYADEHPGDAIAHVLMASSLNALGKHKRALKSLEKAEVCVGVEEIRDLVTRQRRYAEHPDAEQRFRAGADAALTGNPERGEAEMRELLARFPEFWEAHLFLGIALRRRQKWLEARGVLEHLKANQQLPGIDKELTGIYSQLGQPGKALECAKQAMDAAPEDPTLLTNYAAALLENDKIDEAAKYAARAEMLMPGDEPTRKLQELIKLRMTKRGMIKNFAATIKEATSWFKFGRRKK